MTSTQASSGDPFRALFHELTADAFAIAKAMGEAAERVQ